MQIVKHSQVLFDFELPSIGLNKELLDAYVSTDKLICKYIIIYG